MEQVSLVSPHQDSNQVAVNMVDYYQQVISSVVIRHLEKQTKIYTLAQENVYKNVIILLLLLPAELPMST